MQCLKSFCHMVCLHVQQVVGVHMVGPESAEIIQGVAIAMKCARLRVPRRLAMLSRPVGDRARRCLTL